MLFLLIPVRGAPQACPPGAGARSLRRWQRTPRSNAMGTKRRSQGHDTLQEEEELLAIYAEGVARALQGDKCAMFLL